MSMRRFMRMSIHKSISMTMHMSITHVYAHVYTHVYTHVCTQVYTHVYAWRPQRVCTAAGFSEACLCTCLCTCPFMQLSSIHMSTCVSTHIPAVHSCHITQSRLCIGIADRPCRHADTPNDRLGESVRTVRSTRPTDVYTHVYTYVYTHAYTYVYTHAYTDVYTLA